VSALAAADTHSARLLEIARSSLEHGVAFGCASVLDPAAEPPALREPAASFVTLRGPCASLRGCVGTIEPVRALAVDVAENAFRAGFCDPRFAPLREHELRALRLHISVMGPLERLDVRCEEELVARLRPGVDGLVLRLGALRGTFLPAVWESLAEPRAWLRALKRKTGLPADFWSEELEVLRFGATSIEEGP
jgi:AmmeMemoRadiSam system protein A